MIGTSVMKELNGTDSISVMKFPRYTVAHTFQSCFNQMYETENVSTIIYENDGKNFVFSKIFTSSSYHDQIYGDCRVAVVKHNFLKRVPIKSYRN